MVKELAQEVWDIQLRVIWLAGMSKTENTNNILFTSQIVIFCDDKKFIL